MSKNKKKRNKKYSGVDAATTQPVITRIEAVNRNKISQYWFDHKKVAKPILIICAIILFVALMTTQIINLVG